MTCPKSRSKLLDFSVNHLRLGMLVLFGNLIAVSGLPNCLLENGGIESPFDPLVW